MCRFTRSFLRAFLCPLALAGILAQPEQAWAVSPQAANALAYLRQMMDQYTDFGVYADQYSVSNHFEPTGWMGDAANTPGAVTVDPGNTNTWHSGGNSFRITYKPVGDQGWAGIYWQQPGNNWGTVPNGGFNLVGASRLTFWVRGAVGGEQAEFKVGGITGTHGDTIQPAKTTDVLTLNKNWQQVVIDLKNENLSRVVGGFVWVTNSSKNPNGATIYVDDIRYVGLGKKMRLIESYTSQKNFVPPRPMEKNKYVYVYQDYHSSSNAFSNNGFYESGWLGDYAGQSHQAGTCIPSSFSI